MSDMHKNLVDQMSAAGERTVTLIWETYQGEEMSQRGVGICKHTVKHDIPDVSNSSVRLHVHEGETLKLCVTSSKAGYLTIVNLGTTGQVVKMFPLGNVDNHIEAAREYKIPDDFNLVENRGKITGWEIASGSASAEIPERIVAIVTADPLSLSEAAFKLRGGFGTVEEVVSDIRMLLTEKGTWTFGLLEAWVD